MQDFSHPQFEHELKKSWQLYVLLVRYYFRLWFWRNGTSNSQFRRKIPRVSTCTVSCHMSALSWFIGVWGMASPYCSPIKQESKWDLSSPTRWRKARWWSEKHFFQLTLFDHVNGGHKIQPWKGHLKPTKKGNERKNRSTPFSTSIQFEHLEVMWLKLLEMWWIFVHFCIPNTQIFTSLTNFKKQNAIFFFLP